MAASSPSCAAAGARVQRCLWASTSTKNPDYRDVMYVEELIGPKTVNTMPIETIEAFLDHGKLSRTLDGDLASAHRDDSRRSRRWGSACGTVTDELIDEGVAAFAKSFDDLMATIDSPAQGARSGMTARPAPTAAIAVAARLTAGPRRGSPSGCGRGTAACGRHPGTPPETLRGLARLAGPAGRDAGAGRRARAPGARRPRRRVYPRGGAGDGRLEPGARSSSAASSAPAARRATGSSCGSWTPPTPMRCAASASGRSRRGPSSASAASPARPPSRTPSMPP